MIQFLHKMSFETIRNQLKLPHFKAIIPIAWLSVSFFILISAISMLLISVDQNATYSTNKYSIFSAKPLVLGASTSNVEVKDSRADAIDRVMTFYKCPMTGLGPKFVEEADKNNIPFWIVASIAFQESSCGKNTPIKDGKETYNAYGYGVWGQHIKAFDSWEHGIEVMSVYMNEMFYSKGVTDLCVIMKTYTPPSKGSWCEGVGFFRDRILGYKSN